MTQNTEQSLHFSQDGSHTVFSTKFNAHYHSISGAIEESIHVFISAGLFYLYRKNKKNISIFEMGLGTALNPLLAMIEAKKLNLKVDFHSIESYPLEQVLVDQLNYTQLLNLNEKNHQYFLSFHSLPWNTKHIIDKSFSFIKTKAKIEEHDFERKYDLVFYDAFAPACQSHLWEEEVHQKIFNALNPEGVFVSYCTQGAFKRMLVQLGYKIEILNGPGKKREMLRAIKF